jgi:hypothetical protein
LPDEPPTEGIFIIDTAALFGALEGESAPQRRNLERMSLLLGYHPECLHNAGNDAYVSLSFALAPIRVLL